MQPNVDRPSFLDSLVLETQRGYVSGDHSFPSLKPWKLLSKYLQRKGFFILHFLPTFNIGERQSDGIK